MHEGACACVRACACACVRACAYGVGALGVRVGVRGAVVCSACRVVCGKLPCYVQECILATLSTRGKCACLLKGTAATLVAFRAHPRLFCLF